MSEPDDARVSRLPLDDAEDLVVVSVPILDPARLASLTEAERAVVLAVLRGESNAAIAEARGVAPRTVANHLASVFRKLGVASRAELALAALGTSG